MLRRCTAGLWHALKGYRRAIAGLAPQSAFSPQVLYFSWHAGLGDVPQSLGPGDLDHLRQDRCWIAHNCQKLRDGLPLDSATHRYTLTVTSRWKPKQALSASMALAAFCLACAEGISDTPIRRQHMPNVECLASSLRLASLH